jgi:hypothetical protein
MSGESVDTQLSELRRITEVGLAKVDGRLDVLTERDRSAGQMSEQLGRDLSALTNRVDNLDRRVAKFAGLAIGVSGALSAASGLIVWALSHH